MAGFKVITEERRFFVQKLFRWFALQPGFGCQHQPPPCTTNWNSVAEHLLLLIRILIADDFEAWRREVCLLLRGRPELQVVCEASVGSEAVQKADDLKPDLIVLDIGLPKLNGIEAARRIRQLSPNSKILFLSQNNDLAVVQAALGTGALGYVYKMNAQNVVLGIIWRKSLLAIWRKSLGMQELAELSAETRHIALSRFRLLEPHLEQHRSSRQTREFPFGRRNFFGCYAK